MSSNPFLIEKMSKLIEFMVKLLIEKWDALFIHLNTSNRISSLTEFRAGWCTSNYIFFLSLLKNLFRWWQIGARLIGNFTTIYLKSSAMSSFKRARPLLHDFFIHKVLKECMFLCITSRPTGCDIFSKRLVLFVAFSVKFCGTTEWITG